MSLIPSLIFGAVALAYGALARVEERRQGGQRTQRSMLRRRISLIFAAVAALSAALVLARRIL